MKDTKDTIDLKNIVHLLVQKVVWILISCFVCGAIAYVYSAFVMTPTYTSQAKMYVQGSSAEAESVSSADVSIRLRIVPAYQEKLSSNDFRDLLYDALKQDGIEVRKEDQMEILVSTNEMVADALYISVNTTDPKLSYLICDKITEIAAETVAPMYAGFTLDKLDSARQPVNPASPNVRTNTILGVLIGMVLSCGAIILIYMLDTTIKDADSVTEMTELRFMGDIPDMNESFKGGYSYYKYSGHSSGAQGGKK